MNSFLLNFLAAMLLMTNVVGQDNTKAQSALQKSDHQFFIENKGQWPNEVHFLTRIDGLDAWITTHGVVYDFYKLKQRSHTDANLHDANHFTQNQKFEEKEKDRFGHVVNITLKNANASSTSKGIEKSTAYYNYFMRNDRDKWISEVALYQEALLRDVYDNIDERYYFESGNIRYDFIVKPNADPGQIQMAIEGSLQTFINEKGDLVFTTRFGEVKQAGLFTWQEKNGVKQKVVSRFEKDDHGIVSIQVGIYDRSKPLIIDPLVYSTYIGGSSFDDANAIAVNESGNAYITGSTSSATYPTTAGAYDESYTGNSDVFVTKLNNSGSALVYSTFIGGSGYENAYALTIDGSGNAYITGTTASTDYPVTGGAYDLSINGLHDCFVTELNSNGSALIYSTFFGGSAYDEAYAIAKDANGNVYVTGETESTNYPTSGGALSTVKQGFWDSFVTTFNSSGSALIYSTYLGGTGEDFGFGIAVDVSNNAYVTGYTDSSDYPTTAGVFDETFNQADDVFVTKLNSNGSALLYSTFLGGIGSDRCYSITTDANGNAYVTGRTNFSDYPVTAGAFDQTANGGGDVFVTKLNSSASALIFSTFLGGNGNEFGYDIAIDGSENVYISGLTSSSNFPTTAGAYNTSNNGDNDIFVSRLNGSGSVLLYSSFIGGSLEEGGRSIAIDANGIAYITGFTESDDFPTTSNAYNQTPNSSYDVFVLKIDLTSTLPIELSDFTTKCNGSSVGLMWTTVSEINNDYFTIERSMDMIHWQALGTIAGAGNSNQILNYSFTDPTSISGTRYFRLKQTDFDGQFKFSIIRSARCENQNLSNISIYPNPSSGLFYVEGAELNSEINVFNSLHEEVMNQLITSDISEMDLGNLPTGIYFIRIGSKVSDIRKISIIK
ncbi:MAG: SBBP repeat-containing protein [Saprospiraceae bacterium]